MKKAARTLAILVTLIGTAYAATPKPGVPTTPGMPTNTTTQLKTRAITGITMSPTNPSAGELVVFTVTSSSGLACHMQVMLLGPTFGAEMESTLSDKPSGGGKFAAVAGSAKVGMNTDGPGSYTATAHPHKWTSPKCEGEAKLTFVIPDPSVLNPNLPEAKVPGARPSTVTP